MSEEKNKCSLEEHSKIDAIIYCQECKIFMCNKCEKLHSELFKNHHQYKLDKNLKDIFTGYCKEKNHINELKYFCKDHNNLCCGLCITKIKDIKNGQHSDCNVCLIKDIENEKKEKLKNNIENLENLSNNIQESINKIKVIYEEMNEKKENLKIKVQEIFTKIRNILNNREDEILLEIDKKYENLCFKEEIMKKSEKLLKRIKESIEIGKIINKEWNNNKLNILINDCINIEKNIKDINIINENIKKYNSINLNLKFYPENNGLNNFIEEIKKFGKISISNFKFKECPLNINENRKYEISGENRNIITKTGSTNWMGTICENELDKTIEEHKWRIKIIKTKQKYIMVGVAPSDFDINSSSYNTCGFYLWFYYSPPTLYSGPPFNYYNVKTNLSEIKDEIVIIMNMKKRTLKFIINNEDKGDSYTNIPIDKPLYPAVLLYNKDDSVEITDF